MVTATCPVDATVMSETKIVTLFDDETRTRVPSAESDGGFELLLQCSHPSKEPIAQTRRDRVNSSRWTDEANRSSWGDR